MKASVIADPHAVQAGFKSDMCGSLFWAGAQHSQSPIAGHGWGDDGGMICDCAAADCAVLLKQAWAGSSIARSAARDLPGIVRLRFASLDAGSGCLVGRISLDCLAHCGRAFS